MSSIQSLAIAAPREHHDLRLLDVRQASGNRSTNPGERTAHARPVGSRPTRTMQRQLIARMVG